MATRKRSNKEKMQISCNKLPVFVTVADYHEFADYYRMFNELGLPLAVEELDIPDHMYHGVVYEMNKRPNAAIKDYIAAWDEDE